MLAIQSCKSRAQRILWLVAAAALLACGRAMADDGPPPSNLVLMPVGSFGGQIQSVPVQVGDNLTETGPITLSLDPSADNVFGLDNLQAQGVIDVTLLLSSPLFTSLGETPRIRIQEHGPANLVDLGGDLPPPGADFLFHAALTGGGYVQTGLFAGTSFHNVNAYDGEGLLGSWIVRPGSIVTWDIQGNGSVTFPDGTTVNGLAGSGQLTILPEPSGLTLSALGIAALAVMARKRRRAT
jgi:hypothetical protein